MKILGKDFKKHMKENKYLTLKLFQKKKKRKIKKTKYQKHKKLNSKEALNKRLKSESKN